jgi:hypothetical protein
MFGCGKQPGTLRKPNHRGVARITAGFLRNRIADNLIRIPKLIAAQRGGVQKRPARRNSPHPRRKPRKPPSWPNRNRQEPANFQVFQQTARATLSD